jgi:hypothetical protein
MDYQDAKKIRGQSFGSRMADKLTEGQGIGASIKSTLSEGSKARMTGIKEKFDPMNIGKFFGGKLGAAVVGKMTGRSKEDMEHFTGKKSSTKIGKLESGNEMVDMLMKIYSLMKKTNEDNKKMRDDENSFKEEKEYERLRRHKELMEAITGKPYAGKASVVKKENESGPGGGPGGILGDILSAFGGAKSAITLLSNIGRFFLMNPIGLGLLAGASLLTMLYLDPNAEDTNKGIINAGAADGGVGAAIQEARADEVSSRKAVLLREANKNKVFKSSWYDFDKRGKEESDYLKSIGFDDKTGLTQKDRDNGFNAVDEDGIPYFAKSRATQTETPTSAPSAPESLPAPTASPAGSQSPSTPTASPTGSESKPAPTAMAESVSSPNSGQQLNQVQGENLNAKVQETLSKGETVVNNNAISKSLSSNDTKGPLPPVRNHEETFAKMIFDSTRLV